jgi:hypothetical protein
MTQNVTVGEGRFTRDKFKALIFFVRIWSWLADKLNFILSYEAGFYKPTVLKVHPPFCMITSYATMPG